MEQTKLCLSDYRFMSIIWDNEPLPPGQLVNELECKKSTTYTMLKKLAEKGYVQNKNSVVSSLVPKKEVQTFETEYVVNNAFEGYLPAFIAAFMENKRLTDAEIAEIKRLIDNDTE